MKTLSTSFQFATLLLTVACSTTSLLAQQTTARTTTSRQTATAKPHPTLAKPATRPTASTQPKPAATGSVAHQSSDPQPTLTQTLAATPSTQSAPTRLATAGTTATPRAANRTAFSTGSPRNKYLNVGVGLAAYYGAGLPLGASLEVDVKNNVSAGGSFDYLHYSGGYTFIYLGARGSYHLGELIGVRDHKFDPYAGLTLGFRHSGYDNSYGYSDYGSYNSGLYLGVHLGSRYYFSEKVGGFAEVGYGVSALRLGLTAKF